MLQLFESHAGVLDHALFVKFALPYIRVISRRVRDMLKERNVPSVPMVNLNDFNCVSFFDTRTALSDTSILPIIPFIYFIFKHYSFLT